GGVEGVDGAVAEVAHQQGAGEGAERAGGQGQAPRRVERPPGGQALDEVAAEVEHVHEAIAQPLDVVAFGGRILPGVGDVQLVVEVADAEGGEVGRDVVVGEGAEAARPEGDLVEVVVKDVDLVGAEVGGVEEVARAVVADGEPLVDRAGGGAEVRVIDLDDG